MITLDTLGPYCPYRTSDRQSIVDVSGTPVAELCLASSSFVTRTMAAVRAAPPLPLADRIAAIGAAVDEFATGTVAGRSAAEYEYLTSRVGGVPISVVRAATADLVARLRSVYRGTRLAKPAGAVDDWRHPLTRVGRAVWTRRGEVLAVHAAGAHPGAHASWPEALALGYRVAVRPSRRDPFTAHRLVNALRTAGFTEGRLVLLPTDRAGAEAMRRGADLAYGGDDVLRQHAGDPTVLRREPGRSAVLLTAEMDWRDQVDTVVESVIHQAGTGFGHASAVFVAGDPTPLAEAVAERLILLPTLPPEDDKAVLPVRSVAAARALERYLEGRAAGARQLLGGIVGDLGDGSAVLRPAVYLLDRPDAPQAMVAPPFPCVWFAPWSRRDGVAPLRNTVALTAITRDPALVDALVDEPSIGSVRVGDLPTGRPAPDGCLADFLMRTKFVVREDR